MITWQVGRRVARVCLTLAAALALALGGGSPAWAWGSIGHRLITRLALANVTPRTRAAIADLLRAAPQLDTAECHIDSLEDAAIWPDCVRKDDRWAYSAPWHFQNAPVCAALYDPRARCADGNCVTAQIERQRRVLADRSRPRAQRLEALAFLAHFIGDIHQPLHVSDLNHNRGGNDIIVDLPSEADTASLHRLWDDNLVVDLLREEGERSLVRPFPPAERARLATGSAADWARESWRAARFVYAQAFGHDPCGGPAPSAVTLSGGEVRADLPLVRARLILAGLRLARVLDETLNG